jgi:hypothetical protein
MSTSRANPKLISTLTHRKGALLRYHTIRIEHPDPHKITLGFVIYDDHEGRMASTHIYDMTEAAAKRVELEEAHLIKENWPDSDDADVKSLLASTDFTKTVDSSLGPIYLLHQASETIARRRAGLSLPPGRN